MADAAPDPDRLPAGASAPDPAGQAVGQGVDHDDGQDDGQDDGPGDGQGDGQGVGQDADQGADGAGPQVERGGPEVDPGERRRERAISGMLAAGLILEGITVLFVPLAIGRVEGGGLTGARLGLLLALAGALFVVAFLQRRRIGLVLGSVLQVAVVALGLLIGVMWVLGLVFAGIWVYLLRGRQQILEAGRAARTPGAAPPGDPA